MTTTMMMTATTMMMVTTTRGKMMMLMMMMILITLVRRMRWRSRLGPTAANPTKIKASCLRLVNRLVGLVVKASASRAEDPGFESRFRRDFSGVESYHWLKNWHSRGIIVSALWWPGFSILLLGEVESWICNFHVSVAARSIVGADLSLRHTGMLLGC